MSLNNFLCKYFKDENSRYVTMTGFLKQLGVYVVVLSVVIGVLYCIAITVLHLVTGQLGESFIEAIGIAAIGFLLFVIGVAVWDWLSTIKLAECPLKKEEEEKP